MVAAKIFQLCIIVVILNGNEVSSFWDVGTTTIRAKSTDETPRVSFFRWQWVYSSNMAFWFYHWDWEEIERRRRLYVVAGISIDFLPLSTGTILNRRVIVTSYNYLDPYMNRQQQLRIWALGRAGQHNTPYRYRVWRVTRMIPLSLNPEHCHGPYCQHQPRHDVSIIISRDMMYLSSYPPYRYHYAYRAFVPPWKKFVLSWNIWMAGSGFEYMEHIHENYKIFYHNLDRDNIVDCSKYLPKWWGKFICIKNKMSFPGVQNGGGMYDGSYVLGLGCFEIRYNEDRIFVFTDLRYYNVQLYYYGHINPGAYYEYAYPQWGAYMGWVYEGHGRYRYIPHWQIQEDMYPLG